jgi:hypothetical protein
MLQAIRIESPVFGEFSSPAGKGRAAAGNWRENYRQIERLRPSEQYSGKYISSRVFFQNRDSASQNEGDRIACMKQTPTTGMSETTRRIPRELRRCMRSSILLYLAQPLPIYVQRCTLSPLVENSPGMSQFFPTDWDYN